MLNSLLVVSLVVFLQLLPYTALAVNECSVFRRGKETGEHPFTTDWGRKNGQSFREDTKECGSEEATERATAHELVRRRSGFGKRLPQLGKSRRVAAVQDEGADKSVDSSGLD